MKLWDRVEYSAIVDRKPLRLPDNKTVVVWPLVTVEVWDPDGPLPRTILTPPQGVLFVPDVPNWSWAEYGARIGFWRMKAALDKRSMKAVFCINASVIERYPRICEAALKAGWEFMGHNTIQKPMHAMTNEEEAIRQTAESIKKFTGATPRGWMGPGLTETYNTPELLVKAGIEYTVEDQRYHSQAVWAGRAGQRQCPPQHSATGTGASANGFNFVIFTRNSSGPLTRCSQVNTPGHSAAN